MKVQSIVDPAWLIRRWAGWSMVYGLFLVAATPSIWAEPDEEVPQGIMADQAGEPPAQAGADGAAKPSEPSLSQAERLRTVVDLSFTNANLRTVLNSLAKTYELNIVAGESVTGTATLTLRGVTLEEGLRQLLKLNGFEFVVNADVIEIAKLEEKRIAEVLSLKYLTPDTALEFIQPLASEGAILKIDEPTNAILIHDYQKKIEEMRRVLGTVDQPPQQVLIESRLIDITHTDLDNLGLSFTSIANTMPLRRGHLPLVFSSGSYNLASLLSTGSARTSHESTVTVAHGNDSAIANIDALIQNQRVKVLATPSVLTLNNVEARINVGEKFPIREQTQTSTGTLETTRFVDVGTTLRVTPRVNQDGYIQMHIHPEVSSVSSTLDAGPRITTREADTTVLVKDGSPVVIAGLLSETDTGINQRIPVLGHLPLVGVLFQNRTKSHDQKELVVVITPFLIDAPAKEGQPRAPVQQVADRLDALELFAEGLAMEENRTLKAHRLPQMLRYHEAVQIYQQIVDRFPTHPSAMEALWRIGRLAKEQLHDLKQAELAFHQLVTRFPNSPYGSRARQRLQVIRRHQTHREDAVKVTTRSITADFP